MVKEHQAATLSVGSVQANINTYLGGTLPADVKRDVLDFIRRCVDVSNEAKRRAHIALAMYIKDPTTNQATLRTAMGADRAAVAAIADDDEGDDDDDDDDDDDEGGSKGGRGDNKKFFRALRIGLCNGQPGTTNASGLEEILPDISRATRCQTILQELGCSETEQASHVSITELELVHMLLNVPSVANVLRDPNGLGFTTIPSAPNVLNGLAPGAVINKLISPFGLPSAQVIGCKRYRRQTTVMTLAQMRTHLQNLRAPPAGGIIPGSPLQGAVRYVLRGSFLTNGVQLQLRSTRGYGAHLREIRNVFPTRQEVLNIFGPPTNGTIGGDVDVLALDLGEAYTIGACAIRATNPDYRLTLAVSRKALYQPRLKFRRWLETQKKQQIPGTPGLRPEIPQGSIGNIESSLPALDGDPNLVIIHLDVLFSCTHRNGHSYFVVLHPCILQK
ncbi:hypothetical protein BGZ65_012732 [Modicella reniformis]|uniref:Uncharacterized protein n=1 Tax=Modicella reniformis TaxID=1440133 RepID=A0A9P6MJQ9_9FUNG|nr:hypothetical protein BGZ65_012732 [Modicella reniformis]